MSTKEPKSFVELVPGTDQRTHTTLVELVPRTDPQSYEHTQLSSNLSLELTYEHKHQIRIHILRNNLYTFDDSYIIMK